MLTLKCTMPVPSSWPSVPRLTLGTEAALATPMRAWLDVMTTVLDVTAVGLTESL